MHGPIPPGAFLQPLCAPVAVFVINHHTYGREEDIALIWSAIELRWHHQSYVLLLEAGGEFAPNVGEGRCDFG